MKIDVARLELTNPQLANDLRPYLTDGVLNGAPMVLWERLHEWLVDDYYTEKRNEMRKAREAIEKAREPFKKFNEESAAFAASERQRLQRKRTQEAGYARLDQYVRESKLEPTEQNAKLVHEYIAEHFGGFYSEGNIDHAVQQLQHRLRWRI